MEITDAQIIAIADSVDSAILDIAETYKMPPFLLVSVILARLAALCREVDATDELKSLLVHSIASIDDNKDDSDKTIH